jgi:hypothetical protein
MSGRKSRRRHWIKDPNWPISEKLPVLIEGCRMNVWILPDRVPTGVDPLPLAKKFLRRISKIAERKDCEECSKCTTCSMNAIGKIEGGE